MSSLHRTHSSFFLLKEKMSESYKDSEDVVTVFGSKKKWGEVKRYFEYGNILRYFAIAVLAYHAIVYIIKRKPQPELFFFSILQLLDILMRLPLSTVNSETQRKTVVLFAWIYVVLCAFYAKTMTDLFKGPFSIVFSVLVFVLLSIIVLSMSNQIVKL